MDLHAIMVIRGLTMGRLRLGTLLLLVMIAALGLGMAIQEVRHRRREAALELEAAIHLSKLNAHKEISLDYDQKVRASHERKIRELEGVGKADDDGK